MEIIERKQQINEILNTNQSVAEYLKDNLETIKEQHPSHFCKCLGKYDEVVSKHHDSLQKYKDLQENFVSLECDQQKLLKNSTYLLEEKQRLQTELITIKTKSNFVNLLNSNTYLIKANPIRSSKRTLSLVINKKKKKKLSQPKHFCKNKENLSTFAENKTRIISYENDFKEDTRTLLSDMESSLIMKQDTKDLINDRGYSEYFFNRRDELLEKFELMELKSPVHPKNKKDLFSFSKRNSINIQHLQENEIEIKDERKIKRKNENNIELFSVIVFSLMVYFSFFFKVLRFIRRIAKKVGLS